MTKLLCPSMMCADFSNLKEDTQKLDQAGIDIFHMDFMDGRFVPNFGMGLQDFELVRSVTEKPLDVHLMIEEPSKYVEKFADLGADIIYIHPEADQQVTRTLDTIHQKGKKAGIAINPGTSVEMIQELLPLVDYVMVMTVNPGFAGQKYLAYTDPKIEKLVALSKTYEYKVMVDGAISPEKVEQLSKKGVTGFILGTSALFGKTESYEEILMQLRK
ncbi:ribulose-phosphate 3-epimerase [Enterococcus moraviensis ATCC BAA-383]|uniref:Ribulose-phosphate 3-epimerase n=1 Tax=Enterococcus moraviensis ATCC BAA-383 TaxID=1158609 RepID=R2U2K2_9ENTE|nr:ribulose-phosphate 3-epimerase [Enterococcus moraviensis]EOI06947.1 ribulose-phosphate 3-epimerase [Enterococcus moraviensis ATCC BAA-383]EOT65289.1 ribulose-phosphate 3-epimerase [Enterococcus moraviensis ATCC BAA-383]